MYIVRYEPFMFPAEKLKCKHGDKCWQTSVNHLSKYAHKTASWCKKCTETKFKCPGYCYGESEKYLDYGGCSQCGHEGYMHEPYLPDCRYGSKCTRKNRQHLERFYHPEKCSEPSVSHSNTPLNHPLTSGGEHPATHQKSPSSDILISAGEQPPLSDKGQKHNSIGFKND